MYSWINKNKTKKKKKKKKKRIYFPSIRKVIYDFFFWNIQHRRIFFFKNINIDLL